MGNAVTRVPQRAWRLGVPQIDRVQQLAIYHTHPKYWGSAVERTRFTAVQCADGQTTWYVPALRLKFQGEHGINVYLHCPSHKAKQGPVVVNPQDGTTYRFVPTSVLGSAPDVFGPLGNFKPEWLGVPAKISDKELRDRVWAEGNREWLRSRSFARQEVPPRFGQRPEETFACYDYPAQDEPLLSVQPFFHGLLAYAGSEPPKKRLPVEHWIDTVETLQRSLEVACMALNPSVHLVELAHKLAGWQGYLQAAALMQYAAHYVLARREVLGLPEMCQQRLHLAAAEVEYLRRGGEIFGAVDRERMHQFASRGWQELAGIELHPDVG